MFSGIVETVSSIISSEKSAGLVRIQVEKPSEFNDLKIGDSIAVNGVCLTVEAFDLNQITFALAAETLQVLGLGHPGSEIELVGRRLNLERSLRFGDRIHGHLVTGHVDSMGEVTKHEYLGESLFLDVRVKSTILPFVWKKGSLALNGVSLTVNEINKDVISVCLIPETQKRTNLAALQVGGFLTVEPDYYAKAIFRQSEKNLKRQYDFNTTTELVQAIRNGEMVILIDDEDRENEGDLVLAADFVTAEMINFMAKEARGLICLSLTAEQVDRLQLPQMVPDHVNKSSNKTAFTVSIEAASGVSTGISAADRAKTIMVASRPDATSADIHMPGHIFPIRARNGGVLKRAGHTEGSVDLARLAGLNPAAVICEVIKDDGSMARVPDLIAFAKKHSLKIGTIVDLIEYRQMHEQLDETLNQKLNEKKQETSKNENRNRHITLQ